jgi:hypothetical protein
MMIRPLSNMSLGFVALLVSGNFIVSSKDTHLLQLRRFRRWIVSENCLMALLSSTNWLLDLAGAL